jgi:outer membrane receptor for ferrienterochelin and colicin
MPLSRGPVRARQLACLIVLLVAGGARLAAAQVDTSAIRGSIRAEDGTAVAFAEVEVRHEPSQISQVGLSNESGEFAFSGLRVGGPYSVSARLAGFRPAGYARIFLTAGRTEQLAIVLKVQTEEVIEIQGDTTPETTSQRTQFSRDDLEDLPGISRDPKDVVQLMPEAYLDGEGKALSIGGANNRFNSVTIDGVRQDDDFGLNANGYPTSRSPIGMNAIEQITVERSPFDVRYGQFLGGNVNIVTKSGTNDFHGAIVGAFVNQDLSGSKSGTIELDEVDFREARYGVNLGGPILRDRLHFFVSVEGLEGTSPSSVGPTGSGAANEIEGVTVDDVDRARQIARDVYGFDAGVPSQSLDERDLKLLTKLDWQISRRHRMTGRYQRSAGNLINDSAAFDGELPLTSNWYDQRDRLHTFSARLNSSWTSSLSTEVELDAKRVRSRPTPLEGNGFAEATITTADGGSLILGPDAFRHANKLDTTTLHGKLQADYLLGTHLLLGGVELDRTGVFNLFAPSSNGVAEYASLDAFAARTPDSILYSNAISNDPRDAAADLGLGVLAAYAQDQYSITSDLSVQAGVRFETYLSGSDVRLNPNFEARHGFANTATLNGKLSFLPRAGVSYRPLEGLNLRAGSGLYSGGTPNVWLANSYSNDGVAIDTAFSDDPAVISGFDGRTVPTALSSQLMAGDGNVDALDPDFKVPTEWKSALGVDYRTELPGGLGALGLELNVVHASTIHGVRWVDLRRDLGGIDANRPVGTLPDGRPYYDFDDSDGVAFDPRRGYDMLLTNTPKGRSDTVSLSATKPLPLGFTVHGAYAYQNVTEVSPATSSRSVSNYGQAAVADPNDPDAARSSYERRHRLIGSLRYARPLLHDIFGGAALEALSTDLSVFAELRSGQPYSYTFGDSAGGDDLASLFGEEREFARRNRQLFYVPRGDGSDVILDGIDEAAFDRFLADSGLDRYRGRIAPRNAFTSEWYKRVDLRFAQELPVGVRGHKARLFVDVQNLGNLLNRRWGRLEQVPFPQVVPAVDVSVDAATGRYVYSNLRTEAPQVPVLLASLWRIQLSLMYEF